MLFFATNNEIIPISYAIKYISQWRSLCSLSTHAKWKTQNLRSFEYPYPVGKRLLSTKNPALTKQTYFKNSFCISLIWFSKNITDINEDSANSNFIDLKLDCTRNIDLHIVFQHKMSSVTSVDVEEPWNLFLQHNYAIQCLIQDRVQFYKVSLKIHIIGCCLILCFCETGCNLINVFVSESWYLCLHFLLLPLLLALLLYSFPVLLISPVFVDSLTDNFFLCENLWLCYFYHFKFKLIRNLIVVIFEFRGVFETQSLILEWWVGLSPQFQIDWLLMLSHHLVYLLSIFTVTLANGLRLQRL